MYVVTFYSFKGGVGRSMALVNVGVELARTGRRVLLVDFDLEAPGLDTFNLPMLKPERDQPQGVVDFVLRYIEDGRAPDFSEYYFESSGIGQNGGKLWIMPAGRQDETYGDRFKSINWQQLYDNQDGYLLFEDLKQQWNQVLLPDYVLIDSRTGHTDIGGVCTRQLPDAVTILFFPNKQNLRGLKRAANEIRAEATSPRQKQIQLHFVISNVPDLDDEEQILASEMRQFQEALGYRRLAATIHRYDSLALLKQAVFTAERPRSRLAQEYRELMHSIVRENFEDREAAIEFLDSLARRSYRVRGEQSAQTLEQRIERIAENHSADSDVLRRVARLRLRQGRLDEAWNLLNQAVSTTPEDPEGIRERAVLAFRLGHREVAEQDVRRFMDLPGVAYLDVIEIVRALIESRSTLVQLLPNASAFRSLDPMVRYESAWELFDDREHLGIAESILRDLLSNAKPTPDLTTLFRNSLVLALIGQRKFAEAVRLIDEGAPQSDQRRSPQDSFNYAMAKWGDTGTVDPSLFEQVIQSAPLKETRNSPNTCQCLALSYWATADRDNAKRHSEMARQLVMANPRPEFSAWHYLRMHPVDFVKDLDRMDELIDGKEIAPALFREAD